MNRGLKVDTRHLGEEDEGEDAGIAPMNRGLKV